MHLIWGGGGENMYATCHLLNAQHMHNQVRIYVPNSLKDISIKAHQGPAASYRVIMEEIGISTSQVTVSFVLPFITRVL